MFLINTSSTPTTTTMKPLISFEDSRSNVGEEIDSILFLHDTANDKTPTLFDQLRLDSSNQDQVKKDVPSFLQPLSWLPQSPSQNLTFISNHHRFCGLLNNFNNISYSNACIQLLYTSSPRLRDHLIDSIFSPKGMFHQSLGSLFIEMQKSSNTRTVDPSLIFNELFSQINPTFKANEQHDAQKCLTVLLDLLHQEGNEAYPDISILSSQFCKMQPWAGSILVKVKEITPKSSEEAWRQHIATTDNSFFSGLFMGQIETTRCAHVSKTWTTFSQLQLELPSSSSSRRDKSSNKSTLSIADCLTRLTDPVYSANKYDTLAQRCTRCGRAGSMRSQQTFSRAPSELLLLYLKRFDSTGSKNLQPVVLDELLHLCGSVFSLHSVILHTKSGQQQGHYLFALKVLKGEEKKTSGGDYWVIMDDDQVYKESLDTKEMASYLAKNAYICLYRVVRSQTDNNNSNC